jgi:hypothetical protein
VFKDYTKGNPGPGAYDGSKAIENHNGKIVYSRFKSPGAVAISTNSKRFDDSLFKRAIEEPGPGAYTPKLSVD